MISCSEKTFLGVSTSLQSFDALHVRLFQEEIIWTHEVGRIDGMHANYFMDMFGHKQEML